MVNLVYSFPIQLFLLHLKKHPVLMLFWILLIAVSSNSFALNYGGPYLFLNPEYLGKVSVWSYMILGFAIGGFIMTWNTCFYMLNSFRFKFLVSLARPFVNFCFNNFIIPLIFNIIYIQALFRFHHEQETSLRTMLSYIGSMLVGQWVMVIFVVIYFTLFNKNVEKFILSLTEKAKENLEASRILLNKLDPDRPILDQSQWPVETYLFGFFRVRYIRNVDFYDMSLVKRVLRQHHLNTLLIIVVCITIILAYGVLLDNALFRIPAGAAVMLVMSVTTAIACVISYWSGGWRIIAFSLILLFLNVISGYDLIVYKHHLNGLDYRAERKEYSNWSVAQNINKDSLSRDISSTINMLDKWNYRIVKAESRHKPYMVFLQSSGGGSKAAYWGMHVLQQLEKASAGKLMEHTVLMTGASGGMIGSGYFRHLYYLQKKGSPINPLDSIYKEDIGKDILNAIFSAFAANDLIFPLQSFKQYGQYYRKDRAYWFDRQLVENTNGLLGGKLMAYREAEKTSLVPMMVFSPTIINDQRALLISASSVSYLCLPYIGYNQGYLNYLIPDGVEYMTFFKGMGAENIDLVTAMRLNATYPYILPAAYLPTQPEMKIMDAGLKDNHGFGVTTRFINVFRRWIEQYTSGVIIVQIRSDIKLKKMDDIKEKSTLFNEVFLPFGSIYSNFISQQDYSNDLMVAELANSMKVPIHVLPFIYTPADENKEASMSYHLTAKEKQDINNAYYTESNQNMLKRLLKLLQVK
ncbi:MAG: hypothetical protein LC105_03540 [Chitinophagales bacterium]|nr:hypothetical protein [Chitinophagales bacterium]